MYARIRQKLAITSSTQTVTATSLGNIALSLLIKDIGRLVTGQITSAAQLNSQIWDIPNSEVVNTVGAGWSEYQSDYLNTSTNIPFAQNTSTMVYLRCPAQMLNNTGGSVYKYAGLSPTNAYTVPTDNFIWNTHIPWTVTDYTGNPTLNFYFSENSGSPQATGNGRNSFQTNVLTEYVIYATSRCLLISSRLVGSGATAAQKVYMQLEYPATALSQVYNLPNQVIWEVSNGHSAITTGTGASFNTTAYNVVGGYTGNTGAVRGYEIFDDNAANVNLGLVYTAYPTAPTGGWNSLWSTATGTADASTLKPATYASMANTVDLNGNLITIPAMPLIHYPSWDSVYDLSSLTGVYATKSGLGATGDTLTVNGQDYAYLNATNFSYLIPRQ